MTVLVFMMVNMILKTTAWCVWGLVGGMCMCACVCGYVCMWVHVCARVG